MAEAKRLTKKQLMVIDGLLSGEINQKKLFKKYKVSKNTYYKWLSNSVFQQEFLKRLEWLKFQSQLLVMRYISVAAAKLVALTESKSEETARKACLDIISLPTNFKTNEAEEENYSQEEQDAEISATLAGKLLEIIAGEQKKDS